MRESQTKRLSKYLTGTLAIVAGTASADIVYVDINPDHSVAMGNNTQTNEFFDIVIGGDTVMQVGNWNGYSTGDFVWNGLWAQGVNSSSASTSQLNGVMYSGTFNSGDPLGQMLSTNDIIGATGNWSSWGWLGYYSAWTSGTVQGGAGNVGNFNNVVDKYLGVQFIIDSAIHYGWMRFDVNDFYNGFTFKDYAYQDCPNIPIKAGEQTAIMTNVLDVSVNQFGNGSLVEEVEFSFNLAQADTTVSEYRLMVVKGENVASFSASIAKMVNDSLVLKLDSSTVTYKDTLSTDVRDIDGDLLSYKKGGYRIFALSIPNGINANAISLSTPTDLFLVSDLSIADEFAHLSIINNNGRIVINSEFKIEGKISIISVDGKVAMSENINSNSYVLDVNPLSKGIYIVNILSESGRTFSKKVVL